MEHGQPPDMAEKLSRCTQRKSHKNSPFVLDIFVDGNSKQNSGHRIVPASNEHNDEAETHSK